MISVILPVYNEKIEWIRMSVESILNQTYEAIELIIVLDHPSREDVIKYLSTLEATRIKTIIHAENLGLTQSLNDGIEQAEGQYIARMDADDCSLDNRLEVQLDYLNAHPNLDLVGASYYFIDEKGNLLDKMNQAPDNPIIQKLLPYENPLGHPTWLGRSTLFKKLRYKEIKGNEDYDFILRAMKEGYKVGNVQKPLLKYRLRASSISHESAGIQLKNKFVLSQEYIGKKCNKEYNLDELNNQYKKYIHHRQALRKLKLWHLFGFLGVLLNPVNGELFRYKVKARLITKRLMK
jgi:glycosyltransferase involved in cell wall biosynthesis